MSKIRMIPGARGERGIALVSALLVVMLIAIVGATFILMAGNERSVSSNVQVSRGALFAADAGVRVAQQVLANQAKTKLDQYVLNQIGTGPIITSPQTMFAATPQTVTGSNPQFSATVTVTFADSNLAATAQSYDFHYTITSTGDFGAQGQRQVQTTGILRVSAQRGTFADYLCFTDAFLTPSGNPIWLTSSSRFDGRVHTNGEFRFAFKPFFQDLASSVADKAWYYNNGSAVELSANSNGAIDAPQFYGGFQHGAASVPLPANAFDQKAAALGYTPTGSFNPSLSLVNQALGLGSSSTTPPPNGIYVVSAGPAMTGGIYVQGDLDDFQMVADTLANTQRYVMKQNGTTKTIVVDRAANTTTVMAGSTTSVYVGVPLGSIYVTGDINGFHGPDRVGGVAPPAIAADNQLLITAIGDIVVQGDVTCEDYDAANNVLGLYSSGGSIRVGSNAPSNMNLDAFVIATGAAGAFEVDNYNSGSPRGGFDLRGGVVERYYGAFFTFDSSGNLQHGYSRDWHYDRRGLIPPYFPSTNRFDADQPTARTLAWKEI